MQKPKKRAFTYLSVMAWNDQVDPRQFEEFVELLELFYTDERLGSVRVKQLGNGKVHISINCPRLNASPVGIRVASFFAPVPFEVTFVRTVTQTR